MIADPRETGRDDLPAWSTGRYGSTVSRPLHAHRLLIEVELVAAGDMDPEALAGALGRQAIAGLFPQVTGVRRLELNGRTYTPPTDEYDDLIRQLRPPPDPRIKTALWKVREAERALLEALGRLGEDDEL